MILINLNMGIIISTCKVSTPSAIQLELCQYSPRKPRDCHDNVEMGISTQNVHFIQNFKIILQHQIWCHIKGKGMNFTILKSEPHFFEILIKKILINYLLRILPKNMKERHVWEYFKKDT